MIDKKIYHELIPRADEHNALFVNVQADRYLDLTMLGLSKLRYIKLYQSYISNAAKRKHKIMERKIVCFVGNHHPSTHTQKEESTYR